jgi:formylglycine-generating enzyme required for sulfatase activity
MNLLELRFYPIEEKQDCFKVSVEGSSGEVHHEPVLPFLDSETPDAPDRRFTVVKVLESTKFNEKSFLEDEQAWMVREQLLLAEQSAFHPQYLATIGRRLYQVLGQRIQQVIETAVADAKRDRTWLHIRLRFPSDDPKDVRLTDYPWELLHNDYGFLAHQGVTFSRYIAYQSPRPNLPSVNRLNVLLISSGVGDDRMGLKSLPSLEREAIASGLQQAQKQEAIQLEILESPTSNALRRRLLQRQTAAVPHVLHFDGHGFFGKRCNEAGCRKAYKQGATQCECGAPLGEPQGYLVFEQSDGTADYVSAQELGELLGNLERREQPNSGQGIALVVLSGCRTGMSRLSESLFNGVAPNLIGRGIPAVVAMQYSIRVDAASAFTEYFYRSLGQQESLAIALRRGQSAIGIEGNQWYRPVLYLRWQDNEGGQLFTTSSIVAPRESFLEQPCSVNENFSNQLGNNPSLSLFSTVAKSTQRVSQTSLALPLSIVSISHFDVIKVDAVGQPTNRIHKQSQFIIEQLDDETALEMVIIPSGEVVMGATNDEKGRFDDELPQHSVSVTSFLLSRYPITQSQWQAVSLLPKIDHELDPNPSNFRGVNHPIERVSWYDALEFCARLSTKTGHLYRLPSEAEWEYACRSGTETPFYFGETITSTLANYDGRISYAHEGQGIFRQQTTPVDSFNAPNLFGLYDMHGNVWEWCADPWHNNYKDAPSTASIWTINGDQHYRVMRGGSWSAHPKFCRSASRARGRLEQKGEGIGFRVASSL